MKIHIIQHVPFEGLAALERVLLDLGADLSYTRLFEGASFPDPRTLDGLVIMGGPMGVHDSTTYPWLETEISFVHAFLLKTDKPALGICLGAQIIAYALGAPVTKNAEKEIGWFPVIREKAVPSPWDRILPSTFDAFHWHGETFGIPDGAVYLASSEACRNQAFIWNGRALALQFHLESTASSVAQLLANAGNDLAGHHHFVQKRATLEAGDPSQFEKSNWLLKKVVQSLFLRMSS